MTPGSPTVTLISWIGGVALVAIGVLIKRVVAIKCETPKAEAWVSIAGIAVASLGLAVIAYGISRRRLWKLARQAQQAHA